MNSNLLLTLLCCIPAVSEAQNFIPVSGYLCINQDFVETVAKPSNNSNIFCAASCSRRFNCQAFTTADGDCKLFVFDRCSKSVRSSCNCTKRGQVFVKQQSGLDGGALCPSGYGDELCGVKYRLNQTGAVWSEHLARSQRESGLVIMADVTDSNEMTHMDTLATKYSNTFYLGGYQRPGSAEPSDGWYWAACNLTLNSTFWSLGEPNDSPHNENAVVMAPSKSGFGDIRETDIWWGTLFECLSPFI